MIEYILLKFAPVITENSELYFQYLVMQDSDYFIFDFNKHTKHVDKNLYGTSHSDLSYIERNYIVLAKGSTNTNFKELTEQGFTNFFILELKRNHPEYII